MANNRCGLCNGKGTLNRDGKMTKTGKPYDVVCPQCNGIGHYSLRMPPSPQDFEEDDARAALRQPVLA